MAAYAGHFMALEAYIVRGGDVDVRDKGGKTPLHRAAMGHRLHVARLLLDFGADVDARDYTGKTPLHLAVSRDSRGAISDLVRRFGANVNAKDEAGKTPLHYAQYPETTAWLREHGAE